MENRTFNNQLLGYQSTLKSLAKRFTKDQEMINDLVQETFIRAFKYMDQFFHNPRVVSWLFVIMRNVYINQYRRMQHQQNYEDVSMLSFQHQSSLEPFNEDISDKRLMIQDISNIIANLPTSHGQMFKDYVDGYKYRELSKIYGVPEGTVKSRIHIIRKNLQKRFQVNFQN